MHVLCLLLILSDLSERLQVEEFRHLGVLIINYSRMEREIHRQTGASSSVCCEKRRNWAKIQSSPVTGLFMLQWALGILIKTVAIILLWNQNFPHSSIFLNKKIYITTRTKLWCCLFSISTIFFFLNQQWTFRLVEICCQIYHQTMGSWSKLNGQIIAMLNFSIYCDLDIAHFVIIMTINVWYIVQH